MFEKLGLFFDVFRKGEAVADAVKLKNKQNFANAVAALLGVCLTISVSFGYRIPLTPDDLHYVAGFCAVLFGLFNGAATIASTDKIGILPAKQPDTASEQTVSGVHDDERERAMQYISKSGNKESGNDIAG